MNNNVWYCFPIGRKRMAESDDDNDGDDDDDDDDDDGVEEDEENESDEDLETSRKLFFKKANRKKKKKPGRKPKWCSQALDDLIDIIVSNSSYKKKLIFTNTKNKWRAVWRDFKRS